MPDKKKVLFIAHHFPPLGGPGTNRAMQFARYLTELGYDLHVVTVSLEDIAQGSYPPDNTLLDNLPEDLKVTRISIDYRKERREKLIRLKLFRLVWFFLYHRWWEPSARWPKHCFPVCKRIIEEEDIGLVYTSSGPFSAALLGARLRKACDVKWVCDLRDPFTDTYSFNWPSKLHWYFSRWMERRIFRRADKVVVVTPGMKRLYLRRKLIDPAKLTVVTNGYGDA